MHRRYSFLALVCGLLILQVQLASCHFYPFPERDPKVVATQFMEELIRGTFQDASPQVGLSQNSDWGNKYLALWSDDVIRVPQAVQSRVKRYNGLEISQLTLKEISRTQPSPGEKANKLGEMVTFGISWAQRPKGQTTDFGWKDSNEGYITVRWIDYNIDGYYPGGWRIWDLSP